MGREVVSRAARDNRYLHKDFHGALSVGLRYLEREFGEEAVRQYLRQFAAEFYSEWAEALRWQLEEQHMRLLTTLAAACTERGEYKRSADLCQQILTEDEYNEAAWYRLMSNYVLAGQMEAATFCYRKYVDVVSEGLGGEGIPEFEEISSQIRGQR